MAKKSENSPDGIVCAVCGEDKAPYNYFNFRNKYDREFWANGIPGNNNTCFDCAGPYRCICCHEVKPATEFRLQGRICKDCKAEGGFKNTPVRGIARIKPNGGGGA